MVAKSIKIFIIVITYVFAGYSQENNSGGGEVKLKVSECLSDEQHKKIIQSINEKLLVAKQSGKIDFHGRKDQKFIGQYSKLQVILIQAYKGFPIL